MEPTLGRIVLFHGIKYNDSFEHPAIVTKVWSPYCVNLTVFPDVGLPFTITSVCQKEGLTPDDESNGTYSWRWPPKV